MLSIDVDTLAATMLARYIIVLAVLARLAYTTPLDTQTQAAAYCTNKGLSYKVQSIDAPVYGKGNPGKSSTWDLTIDDTGAADRQNITGFGAAVTDATVTSFGSLSGDALDSLLEELSHFNLMRHTIGSSDLSGDPAYTFDDNGGNADDSLGGFGLGDRGNAMAALIKSMRSMNPNMQLLGSPWSPPAWMKLNGQLLNGSNNNLKDGYLDNSGPGYSQQFADYFVRYIQAFNNAGAHVDAITIQNEPLHSQDGYPTMYMYDYESANLIRRYVGPALRNASIGTAIWAYDHNTDHPEYVERVMDRAGDYVDSAAWHCYAPSLNWTVLSDFHDKYPHKKQYMTECYTSSETAWDWAANFTMGPLQNWASGAIAWTLGTDNAFGPHLSTGGCSKCRGLAETNNGGYKLNVDYYVMAQFSKFMPPGATILSGTGSYSYPNRTGIQSVASRNPDGTRTVVIWNKFGNAVYVTATMGSGQVWSGNVPATSVVTWVLPGSSQSR